MLKLAFYIDFSKKSSIFVLFSFRIIFLGCKIYERPAFLNPGRCLPTPSSSRERIPATGDSPCLLEWCSTRRGHCFWCSRNLSATKKKLCSSLFSFVCWWYAWSEDSAHSTRCAGWEVDCSIVGERRASASRISRRNRCRRGKSEGKRKRSKERKAEMMTSNLERSFLSRYSIKCSMNRIIAIHTTLRRTWSRKPNIKIQNLCNTGLRSCYKLIQG